MPVVCTRNASSVKDGAPVYAEPKIGHLGRQKSGQEERLVECRKHIQKTLEVERHIAAALADRLNGWDQVEAVLSAKSKTALDKVLSGVPLEDEPAEED